MRHYKVLNLAAFIELDRHALKAHIFLDRFGSRIDVALLEVSLFRRLQLTLLIDQSHIFSVVDLRGAHCTDAVVHLDLLRVIQLHHVQ